MKKGERKINLGGGWDLGGTYPVFDQRRQGKVIEKISKELPNVGVAVFSEALIIEAIPTAKRGGGKKVVRPSLNNQGGGGEVTHTCVICRLSWFPLRMVTRSL